MVCSTHLTEDGDLQGRVGGDGGGEFQRDPGPAAAFLAHFGSLLSVASRNTSHPTQLGVDATAESVRRSFTVPQFLYLETNHTNNNSYCSPASPVPRTSTLNLAMP